MKYYKIDEQTLFDLILDRHYLAALNHGGVYDWPWYFESIREYINKYPDAIQEWIDVYSAVEPGEEVSIYDIDKCKVIQMLAEKELKNYEEIKEEKE